MAIRQAITEPRDVKIEFSNAHNTIDGSEVAQIAAPVDAFKAAVNKVEEMEGKFAKLGAAGVPDLAGVQVICTGTLPFQIHVFTVTTTMASADYEFIYVETVPTVADVS